MRREVCALLLAMCGCHGVEEPSLPPPLAPETASAPLTIDDCVRYALESAPTHAAFEARRATAAAARARAGLLPNPTLSFEAEDIGASDAPVQYTASFATALADWFARPWRKAAAEHDEAAELAAIEADRMAIAAEVERSAVRLLAARERAGAQAQLAAIAADFAEATRARFDAGDAPQFEVDAAETEQLAIEGKRFEAEAAARVEEIALAYLIGFDRPVALALDASLDADLALDSDLGTALAAAARHPRLRAATERYLAALERADLDSRRLQFLPSISAGPRAAGGEHSAVAGLELELPVFDRGDAAIAESSAGLLAAAAELRAATRDVSAAAAGAAEAYRAALDHRDRFARPLLERRAALRAQAQDRFVAGELDYEERTRVLRDEAEARLERIEADEEAALAAIELALATGTTGR